MDNATVLCVEHLCTSFFTQNGEIKAVNDVSISVARKNSRHCWRVWLREEHDGALHHAASALPGQNRQRQYKARRHGAAGAL